MGFFGGSFRAFVYPCVYVWFFWLWIVPFTAVIIFFLRAMIDDAIARVAQKGDAAVQAKAMIPEFIKMNIVMTVLLSLPFVSALWLNHAGHIQVIQQSEIDKELWRFCLWILKSLDEVKRIEIPAVQILLSNMFSLILLVFLIFITSFKIIKKQIFILLCRDSYGFLRNSDKPNDLVSKGGTLLVIICVYFFLSSYQSVLQYTVFHKTNLFFEYGEVLIRASFLSIIIVMSPVGLYVQSKIRGI